MSEEKYGIGTENLKAFMKFLLLKGLATKTDDGEIITKNIMSDEMVNALKEFNELYTTPAMTVTPKRAQDVTVEVTKAGKEIRKKSVLPVLYEECGGVFTTGNTKAKKPKPVTTVVSLSFEELEEWKIHIPEHKQITRADIERAIHATTLYLAGNEVITTDMLFRQMNGENVGQPTQKWREECYDSFSRLGQTWITIDSSEEVKAGYNDKPKFKGALLPCSMVIGGKILVKGKQVTDAIKIYDVSPLIKYALAKRQVSNIPVKMFNIPKLRSTDGNIELLGYMTRAFASMQNAKSKIKPVILCETVYDYLGVTGNTAHAINNRKAEIREAIRAILTTWVDGKFIKGFSEMGVDGKPARQGVKTAKFELELYSLEEFKKIHKEGENSLDIR